MCIRNLKPKHVDALVVNWIKKDLSAATIQNRLSSLRQFCRWIGKPQLIGMTSDVVPASSGKQMRRYVADKDKSWSATGVNVEERIEDVEKFDHWVGLQLRLMYAFGLRRKEAIMFQPHLVVEPDGAAIQIYKGTKGGRWRRIAEFMRTCKGRVMVSINDHPDIRRCFDGFWMEGLDIKYSTGNAHGAPQTSRELVICNWEPTLMGGLF